MADLDITEFTRLNTDIPADALSTKSGNLPYWLEEAIRKTRQAEREEQALEQKIQDESPENQAKRKYEQRINDLFTDFDKNLPKDYTVYKTPELEQGVNASKDNIRLFADDMYKLSELAGGNPKLEQQAGQITANLLDRLKNDLGLTTEERKQLEGKSLDEIKDYYAQTRSDKLDKLNDTVNGYRQELHQLIEQTAGKSPEEKAKIYQDKLDEIDYKTGQKKENERGVDFGMGLNVIKHESVSINDVKAPVFTSNTVSELDLAKKQNAKTFAETSI